MLLVTITGNLGADAEKRFTQEGKPVLSFRVGVNNRRRNKDGEYEEHSDWFRVRVMGGRVDYFADNLKKGMRVTVVGGLQIDTYQDRNGEFRVGLDVFANEVDFTRRQGDVDSTGDGEYNRATHTPGRAPAAAAAAADNGADLEDLPFRVPLRISQDASSVLLGGIL